jgi:hypothetical protein
MKPDLYTKAVLTVIAGCLVAIVARNVELIPTANASNMNAAGILSVPLNEDGSMNVRVIGMPQTVDVNIANSSATVDVQIVKCKSYALQYAGPMAVNVNN